MAKGLSANVAVESTEAPLRQVKGVLDLVATSIQHETFQQAANALVNDLAVRLRCDRVSLGLVRGGHVRTAAVSHASAPSRKGRVVDAIEAAMEEALDQKETVVFPPAEGVEDGRFVITRMHGELSKARHGVDNVCSVPLSYQGEVAGILTLERQGELRFSREVVDVCETALNLAGPLLLLKRRDERLILTKVGESCAGVLRKLLGPDHPGWKLAGLGLGILVVFLAVAKGDYRVSARTVLEGSVQRAAVAPFDGYVTEANVRAGDIVKRGQVMCCLDDKQLRLELIHWQSQHEQFARQYQEALARREAAQVKIFAARMKQARAQIDLAEYKLSRTTVTAPFDGVVVSGDLHQSIGGPVRRGQLLFEVAPLDDYRVVLEVDERDVAQLDVDQTGHVLLTAFPQEDLAITVERITPVSSTREGRSFFQVDARLEAERKAHLRPGMEGVAKINVGRRRLIWIWTHRAIDGLRLALWSWLP